MVLADEVLLAHSTPNPNHQDKDGSRGKPNDTCSRSPDGTLSADRGLGTETSNEGTSKLDFMKR